MKKIIHWLLIMTSRRENVATGQRWTDGTNIYHVLKVLPEVRLIVVAKNAEGSQLYSRAAFNELRLWLTND